MPVSWEVIRNGIEDALRPRRFFVAAGLELEWEHVDREVVAWELFQGRLLDATQTREERSFAAWNIYQHEGGERSGEALLSVKLDAERGHLHVVRAIYSYAWEGYHAGENIYLSREIRKWLRELVGSLRIDGFDTSESLARAICEQMALAVMGTSRLPLTSLEAPLPAFSLGQLAYFSTAITAPGIEPMRAPAEMIEHVAMASQTWGQKAKTLESLLRAASADMLPDLADRFVQKWLALGEDSKRLAALMRTVFDHVALSPCTDFVEKTLAFARHLEERRHWEAATHADFLAGMLRQLARHLTAYDLVTFHHRGANYPDALLLDAALSALLDLAERHPELFSGAEMGTRERLRRRALRQAVLLRCQYEGQPVPDLPTSPGENSRVLPASFPRVPEEQIADPSKRVRKLYDGDPLLPRLGPRALDLLRMSVEDLRNPAEVQELGMALFLDRPLGIHLRPGEPDGTPLLSYEAYSRSIAERRIGELGARLRPLFGELPLADWREGLAVPGVPIQALGMRQRPGVASLADAMRVADDFVLVRTTGRSAREFLGRFDFSGVGEGACLDFLGADRRLVIVGGVIVGGKADSLRVYDEKYRLKLEVGIESLVNRGHAHAPSGCHG